MSSPDGRCRVVELDLVEFDSVEYGWHDRVRLCVGRCRVGWFVLVQFDVGSRAGQSEGGSRVGTG